MGDTFHRGRTLLPAPSTGSNSEHLGASSSGDRPPNDLNGPRQKRSQISVACEVCRKRKAKCDGIRPHCTPCSTRGLSCEYVADPDATRMTTLKRKFHALEERQELYGAIFTHIQRAPSPEALAIFERIRSGLAPELVMSQPFDTSHNATIVPTTEMGTIEGLSQSPAQAFSAPADSEAMNSVRNRMNVNALLADIVPQTRPRRPSDADPASDATTGLIPLRPDDQSPRKNNAN